MKRLAAVAGLLLSACGLQPQATDGLGVHSPGVVTFTASGESGEIYRQIDRNISRCFEQVDDLSPHDVAVRRQHDALAGIDLITVAKYGPEGPPVLRIRVGRVASDAAEVQARYEYDDWKPLAEQVHRWISQGATSCRPALWVPERVSMR